MAAFSHDERRLNRARTWPAQARQTALMASKGITPQENAVSTQLKQESAATVAMLNSAATGVDALYVESQVVAHSEVLRILDETLLPSTENSDLKAELQAARGEVKRIWRKPSSSSRR